MRTPLLSVVLLASAALSASAQSGAMVYRLGRDTVAVEQFTRTRSGVTGEMVTRSGPAVQRVQYEITLGNTGRPTSASFRRRQADGTPFPNQPGELRFTFRGDSATRTIVWPDSSPSRTFAAPGAFPAMTVFAFGPLELLHALKARGTRVDSLPAVPQGGGNVGFLGLETLGGDTLRLRGGFYPMLLRFDREGRLQSVDGSFTTLKTIGTRVAGPVDIAAIARTMKPTGVLSPRQTAHATFAQGPIMINYGSPAVRGRTVWGGALVPFDSIWRMGANEATHLATSKTIQLGDLTLTPGMYTLWMQHTRAGTFLIVNRQVGQWGTIYDPKQDVGRVAMELKPVTPDVEDLTITIRPAGPGRGAIDVAWGDQLATTGFTVRP